MNQDVVIVNILCRLNLRDLLKCRLVSSKWEKVFQSSILERHISLNLSGYSWHSKVNIFQSSLGIHDVEPNSYLKPPPIYLSNCDKESNFQVDPDNDLKIITIKRPPGRNRVDLHQTKIGEKFRAITNITTNHPIDKLKLYMSRNQVFCYTKDQDYFLPDGIRSGMFSQENPLLIHAHNAVSLEYKSDKEIIFKIEYYTVEDIPLYTYQPGFNKPIIPIFRIHNIPRLIKNGQMTYSTCVPHTIYIYATDFRPLNWIKIRDVSMDLTNHIMYSLFKKTKKVVYKFEESSLLINNIWIGKKQISVDTSRKVNIIYIKKNVLMYDSGLVAKMYI